MRRKRLILISIAVAFFVQQVALADPEQDRIAFVAFFTERFPDIPVTEFANGIYAIDRDAREQWTEIEIFPPYEFAVEQGQELWQQALADGSAYAECFSVNIEFIRPGYPRYDNASNEVVTLDLAVNRCRVKHNEIAYEFNDARLVSITAYLAFVARGNELNITVPSDDPNALAAYESGKRFYYSKRGQLNFACSDCHGISAGQYVRADRLSAGLGHPTHFPVYRSKLGRVISLHERFSGCVSDVRANPFPLQSEEYRNLEYFLTYMSNGLEVNGPGSRK